VLYPTELRGHIVFSTIRFTSSALRCSISSYLSGVQSQQKVNTTLVPRAKPECSPTNRLRYRIFNPVPQKNIFDSHELEQRVNSKSTAFKVQKPNHAAIQTRIRYDGIWPLSLLSYCL
jgi:hypothetical protein